MVKYEHPAARFSQSGTRPRFARSGVFIIDAECLSCSVSGEKKLIHVMKFEEKRTDVNIATEMLRDAYTTDARAFALVSGDSDFTAPLDLIRKELNKRVIVFNPKERQALKAHPKPEKKATF